MDGASTRAWRGTRNAALAIVLAACGLGAPPALPSDFPSDFPTPPSATLLSASGPSSFMAPTGGGFIAQWKSSLSRAEVEAFYGLPHAGWRAEVTLPGASSGPFGLALPTLFRFTHESDGLQASVIVGLSIPGDSARAGPGTLVQVAILPPRPSPSPTSR